MEMLDCVGIPEFFATTIGKIEQAGGGCIRAYVCVEKGGLLVPQYAVVMPALNMIAATKRVQEAALCLFNQTREGVPLAVH